jgi:hypothetical protein
MKDDTTTAGEARSLVNNFDSLSNGGQQAFAGWVRSNEAIVQGTFDLAQQMLSFGQARLADDLGTFRALLSCHDLGEVTRCQREFAEKAVAQYLEQANKVSGALTALFTKAASAPGTDKAAPPHA